jgi:short-subunit dehydrogenase
MLVQQLDVTDDASAASAIEAVAASLGGIDLLVNAAGNMTAYRIEDADAMRRAELDVATNFLGSIRMTRLALPHLRQSKTGGVVMISSVVALAPAPGFAIYSATKAAVRSLARSMRQELAGDVSVYEVLPTWTDTPQATSLKVDKLTPDQVAAAIVSGIERDRREIRVGRAGTVDLVNRLRPSLAEALVARATRSR